MHRKPSPVVAPACPSLCSPCSGLGWVVKASLLEVVSFYSFISPSLKILKGESREQQYSHLQWVPFNSPPQTVKLMTFQRTIRRPKASATVNTQQLSSPAQRPRSSCYQTNPYWDNKQSFSSCKESHTHTHTPHI